ncbi:MAG TPA: hypothetical protein VHT91_18225 [Kofleriaceae bacterium]|nr:hypothetical protein [Kofleriaceae bacterium]
MAVAAAPRTSGGDRPSDGERRRWDGDLLALASSAAAAGAMAVRRASSRCEDVDLGDHRGDQPSGGQRWRCVMGVSNIQVR